jgi:Na+/melibiose symporter-like transporter
MSSSAAPRTPSIDLLPLRYGAMQAAFSALALPLYVFLPAYYAREASMPLATIGVLLFVPRLFDAFTDPLIGRLADQALHARRGFALIAVACVPMLLGFLFLLGLPSLLRDGSHPLAFNVLAIVALLLTYAGFSAATITHQAWGAALRADEAASAELFAWREALGLLGVLLAAVAGQFAGARGPALMLTLSLAAALILLRPLARHPGVPPATAHAVGWRAMREPLRQVAFRRLLTIQTVSAVASSVPATLVLFFIRDRIGAPTLSGLFLVVYFGCAAVGAPLWGRMVRKFGAARAWFAGMVATVVVFAFAATLRVGDVRGYACVCAGSGLMLGADLVLPPTLLAGLIRRLGHSGSLEGAYFALWNMAAKLALALAAGLALPMLAWLGYTPGTPSTGTLPPLVIAYCLLPAAMKIVAAAMLRGFSMEKTSRLASRSE